MSNGIDSVCMIVPPEIQARLISLRQSAKSEREFKKFVWANGLQEYLTPPTNDYDRAKQLFRQRKGHRPLSPNSAFDLAYDCLKQFGLIP